MTNVVISGRLTGDVEVKQAGKTVVANVTIASNKDKEHTDFIPVTLWGDVAQNVAKYVKKGMRLTVIGELTTNSYEKNGIKITKYSGRSSSRDSARFRSSSKRPCSESPPVRRSRFCRARS